MTAWIAIVVPICLITKCAVDFMGLEYGDTFQPMTDNQFLLTCVALCALALSVDFINLWRYCK